MDEFERWQRRRGLKPRTIASNTALILPAPLTKVEFEKYLDTKIEKCRASYVNRIICAVRLYGEFSGCEWMKEIKRVRDKRDPVKSILSDEQIELFLSQRPTGGSYDKFYRMMDIFWLVMAYTGMRTVEASTLTRNDLNWSAKMIELNDTKTGQFRKIPIYEPIEKPLRDYVASIKTDLLFPSRNNKAKAIDHHVWGKSFNRRLKMAGISKRDGLTAYSLRHSFCSRLGSEAGGNASLLEVQRIMGHTDPRTTSKYFHLDDESLRQTIRKLPLARKHVDVIDYLKELIEYLVKALRVFNPISVDHSIEEDGEIIYFTFKAKFKKKS